MIAGRRARDRRERGATEGVEDALLRELLDPAFLGRIERMQLRLRRLRAGDGIGDLATAREGLGTLFREHRAYTPGDDPRRLDWNAYLRLGNLLTITTEAEEAPRLTILLDQSSSMALHDGAKRRHATMIAAGLGALALLRGASLHVVTWPDIEGRHVFRGRGQMARAFRRLAAPTAPSEGAWQEVAERTTRNRTPGPAVLFSDFFESRGMTEAIRALRGAGHDLQLVRVHDPREFALPSSRRLALHDVETGRQLKIRLSKREAEAYTQALDQHLNAIRTLARRLGVPMLETPVDTPPEAAVMALLREMIVR